MARNKKRSLEVEEVRAFIEGAAKNLADRIWGPKGPKWGTKLTELENLVVEIQEVLSEKMLELGLERQALTPAEERPAAFRNCSGWYPEPTWRASMPTHGPFPSGASATVTATKCWL